MRQRAARPRDTRHGGVCDAGRIVRPAWSGARLVARTGLPQLHGARRRHETCGQCLLPRRTGPTLARDRVVNEAATAGFSVKSTVHDGTTCQTIRLIMLSWSLNVNQWLTLPVVEGPQADRGRPRRGYPVARPPTRLRASRSIAAVTASEPATRHRSAPDHHARSRCQYRGRRRVLAELRGDGRRRDRVRRVERVRQDMSVAGEGFVNDGMAFPARRASTAGAASEPVGSGCRVGGSAGAPLMLVLGLLLRRRTAARRP